jgi:hypothetical protein
MSASTLIVRPGTPIDTERVGRDLSVHWGAANEESLPPSIYGAIEEMRAGKWKVIDLNTFEIIEDD